MTIQESLAAPLLAFERLGAMQNDRLNPDGRAPTSVRRCGGEARTAPALDADAKSANLPRTRGEVEAAICVGISRFEQDYLGRGPADIRAHVLADLVVVRLYGVLTLVERKLVTSSDVEKGRDLVKQVRTHLLETARPALQAMIEKETGGQVVSLHHDLSTVTGEEVILFTLAAEPVFRETKSKAK